MATIAINVLWFLIGLIILCGIVYMAIWVIEQFIMPIPEQIKKGVWVIVLLLALIFLIGTLTGHVPFQFGKAELSGRGLAALSTPTAVYL